MVCDRKCSQGEDKWGKFHGPFGQWCPGKHHHTKVHEQCMGLGNAYTRPLGYVVIQVQVDGVWGYNEDPIALVILDFSNFSTRVPLS